MKKVLLTAMAAFSLATPVFADSTVTKPKPIPIPAGALSQQVATITFTFDSGNVRETDVSALPSENTDAVIEQKLKRMWGQGGIKQITHINGKPIEQTKWAKYGGLIPKIGVPGGVAVNPSTGGSGTTPSTGQTPTQGQKPPLSTPAKVPTTIRVVVDNEPVYFEDYGNVQPFIKENRTLVPMRAVFEHFNIQATVKWDNAKRTVTATNREGKTIIFTIDSKEYQVIHPDGRIEKKLNDVAPTISNSRTMLPLRALGESLGFVVIWFDPTKVVDMKAQGKYREHLLDKKLWADFLKKNNQEGECGCQETQTK